MRRILCALIVLLSLAGVVSAQQRLAPPKVTSLPSACNVGDIVNLTTGTVGDYVCTSANTWASTPLGGGGSGSVTSVGWTGGLVSVGTPTSTPAFTVAGTSGGIPYFSSSSTWATSAALSANALVIGGGAGAAPSTTTTGANVLTALGVAVGSAGAVVVNGGAGGTPSSLVLTNATGSPTLTAPTVTTLNGNTFTTGTYTLTGAASKTLTFSNTLTLAGTDATTMTFPTTSATIARTDAANTFTGSQTIAALVGPATLTEAVGSSALTLTGATQTSSFPVLSATQTWNNSGTTFTGLKLNITNTAAAAASVLADLQVGGASMFSVRKDGFLFGPASGTFTLDAPGGTFTLRGASTDIFSAQSGVIYPNSTTGLGNSSIGWSTLSLASSSTATGITLLASDTSNVLALRNSTNAQEQRWYASFTDTSNYTRASLLTSTSTITLSGQSAGTGSSNIDIAITPKGTGVVTLGTSAKSAKFLGNGTAPAVTNTSANSCGTTAATLAGTDVAGKVTVGATSGTSCTVTFATVWGNAPSCTVSNETTANLARATSTTSTVILAGAFIAGDVLAYQCLGF